MFILLIKSCIISTGSYPTRCLARHVKVTCNKRASQVPCGCFKNNFHLHFRRGALADSIKNQLKFCDNLKVVRCRAKKVKNDILALFCAKLKLSGRSQIYCRQQHTFVTLLIFGWKKVFFWCALQNSKRDFVVGNIAFDSLARIARNFVCSFWALRDCERCNCVRNYSTELSDCSQIFNLVYRSFIHKKNCISNREIGLHFHLIDSALDFRFLKQINMSTQAIKFQFGFNRIRKEKFFTLPLLYFPIPIWNQYFETWYDNFNMGSRKKYSCDFGYYKEP